MSTWFYKRGGQQLGPVSSEELKALASQGELLPKDLLRRGTQGVWIPAGKVQGLFPVPRGETIVVERTEQVPSPVVARLPSASPPPPRVAALSHPPGPPTLPNGGPRIVADPETVRALPGLRPRRRARRSDRILLSVLILAGLAVMGGGVWFMIESQPSAQSADAGAADGKSGGASLNLDELALGYNKDLAREGQGKRGSGERWFQAGREQIWTKTDDGRLAVSVKSVAVGVPPKLEARGARLIVTVRLENQGSSQPVKYRSWGRLNGTARDVVLKDERGRTYRTTAIVSQREPIAAIASGETVEDVLLFELPDAGAKQLRLELPGAAVGAREPLRFQIPIEMVKSEPDDSSLVSEEGGDSPADKGRNPEPLDISAYTAAQQKKPKPKPTEAAMPRSFPNDNVRPESITRPQ